MTSRFPVETRRPWREPELAPCPNCTQDARTVGGVRCAPHGGDGLVVTAWACRGCRELFLRLGTTALFGPVPRAEVDRVIEGILACPYPDDGSCGCPVHGRLHRITLALRRT